MVDMSINLAMYKLVLHNIGIYHSAISAFMKLHHIHKTLNHPVISMLMHHFYLQCPPTHEHLVHAYAAFTVFVKKLIPASSITDFKLS